MPLSKTKGPVLNHPYCSLIMISNLGRLKEFSSLIQLLSKIVILCENQNKSKQKTDTVSDLLLICSQLRTYMNFILEQFAGHLFLYGYDQNSAFIVEFYGGVDWSFSDLIFWPKVWLPFAQIMKQSCNQASENGPNPMVRLFNWRLTSYRVTWSVSHMSQFEQWLLILKLNFNYSAEIFFRGSLNRNNLWVRAKKKAHTAAVTWREIAKVIGTHSHSSYSCNKITTIWIQISRQNWNGFFINC